MQYIERVHACGYIRSSGSMQLCIIKLIMHVMINIIITVAHAYGCVIGARFFKTIYIYMYYNHNYYDCLYMLINTYII